MGYEAVHNRLSYNNTNIIINYFNNLETLVSCPWCQKVSNKIVVIYSLQFNLIHNTMNNYWFEYFICWKMSVIKEKMLYSPNADKKDLYGLGHLWDTHWGTLKVPFRK